MNLFGLASPAQPLSANCHLVNQEHIPQRPVSSKIVPDSSITVCSASNHTIANYTNWKKIVWRSFLGFQAIFHPKCRVFSCEKVMFKRINTPSREFLQNDKQMSKSRLQYQ